MVQPSLVRQSDAAAPVRAPDGTAYVFDMPPGRVYAGWGAPFDKMPHPSEPERRAYEAVVRAVWAVAVDRLRPRPRGRLYDGWQVALGMPPAIAACVERTRPATHEALLAALGCDFEPGVYGAIERGCPCGVCCSRARFQAELECGPPGGQLREYVAFILARHLEYVLKAPEAYDHHLGAPLVAWSSDPPDALRADWLTAVVPTSRPPIRRAAKPMVVAPAPARAFDRPDLATHRSIYERWAPLAGRLVTDPLTPTPGGGYCAVNLDDRLEPVVRHMALAVVPVEEQLAFLRTGESGPPLDGAGEADPATEAGRRAINACFTAVLAAELRRSLHPDAPRAWPLGLDRTVDHRWPILRWPDGRPSAGAS